MKTIIIDGVEYYLTPKALFKKGDWIVYRNEDVVMITDIVDNGYLINKGGCILFTSQGDMRYWTIQDAKDGDVLANEDMVLIFKCFEEPSYRQHIIAYIGLDKIDNIQVTNESWNLGVDCVKPATEKQYDRLFQKIKEAGYKWDADEKELKKIEQEQIELPKGEDYGIDGLYHAARILEKTLGEVEGYQSDDGILEHKCAIEAVKRLYKQKPTWSEEDEKLLNLSLENLTELKNRFGEKYGKVGDCIHWLKSLRPQPKKEWSEKDEIMLDGVTGIVEDWYNAGSEEEKEYYGNCGYIDWLKSLKERMKGE